MAVFPAVAESMLPALLVKLKELPADNAATELSKVTSPPPEATARTAPLVLDAENKTPKPFPLNPIDMLLEKEPFPGADSFMFLASNVGEFKEALWEMAPSPVPLEEDVKSISPEAPLTVTDAPLAMETAPLPLAVVVVSENFLPSPAVFASVRVTDP
jgi:hypothetical protein